MINIINLVAYRKNNEQISSFQDKIKQYFPPVKKYTLYTDQTRDSLAYQQMKEDISDKNTIVLMDSINDLSFDSITQIHEIDWFLNQSISCIFFTYTTMLEHPENNQEHLRLLKDYVISSYQKRRSFHLIRSYVKNALIIQKNGKIFLKNGRTRRLLQDIS